MPLYICKICGKEFDQKIHYINHLRRKIPCQNNDDVIDLISIKTKTLQNTRIYKCSICEKEFITRSGLYKHKQKHDNYDVEIRQIINIGNQEINKLKDIVNNQQIEIEKLKKNKQKTIYKMINNQQNINNINNGTLNVLIGFGHEDIYKLKQTDIKEILFEKNGTDPLLKCIELMHFNKEIPEQQNVKLTGVNSKYADIYDGKKWIKELLTKVMDEILDNNIFNLNELVNQCGEQVKDKIKQSVQLIIEEYNIYTHLNNKEKKDKNNELIIKINNLINEIKLLIYNKTNDGE